MVRNEGHQPDNGRCTLCGGKMLRADVFTSEEMSLIGELMLTIQGGGQQVGEKEKAHASELVKLSLQASITGDGWLSQEDINFISRMIMMYASALGGAGKHAESAKYNTLIKKLVEMDENATPQMKMMANLMTSL
jgi:hypothetical protein